VRAIRWQPGAKAPGFAASWQCLVVLQAFINGEKAVQGRSTHEHLATEADGG
jgi:hypothetical protein